MKTHLLALVAVVIIAVSVGMVLWTSYGVACSKPVLDHLERYSNVFDDAADDYVIASIGLPFGVSQKSLDSCAKQIIEQRKEHKPAQVFENASVLKPDSVELFYYPNPHDRENRDAFDTYLLIRLPEWLGGDSDDASAYRIYSAKSVDDSCMVKYWPGEDRQRIENPCRGGFYRVHDGVMILNFGSVPSTNPVALPHLDVSIDQNGFLFVEPPTFSKTANGVISYGREVTPDAIQSGSQFYIDSFAEHFPTYPPIRKNFAGLMLADIVPLDRGAKILYSNFGLVSNVVDVTVFPCHCDELRGHHSYEILEKINGVTVAIHDTIDKHPQVNESSNKHYFRFIHDGFEYHVSGKDPGPIRKSIASLLSNHNVPLTPEIGKVGTYKLVHDGTLFDLKYSIIGASIDEISMSDVKNTMTVRISPMTQGDLEITIPRQLHDSKDDYCPPTKANPPDDQFFVLLDGMEIAYDETKTTSESRTLKIPLGSDSGMIQVVLSCFVETDFVYSSGILYSASNLAQDSIPTQNQR